MAHNLFPLEWFFLQVALIKITESSPSIIASKDIDLSFVDNCCVICSGTWRFSDLLDDIPSFSIEIVVEEIVIVLATLLLVASTEVKTIFVNHYSCT